MPAGFLPISEAISPLFSNERQIFYAKDEEDHYSSGTLLPEVHLAPDAAALHLYTQLLSVYAGGGEQIRRFEGRLAGNQAYLPLPSFS